MVEEMVNLARFAVLVALFIAVHAFIGLMVAFPIVGLAVVLYAGWSVWQSIGR